MTRQAAAFAQFTKAEESLRHVAEKPPVGGAAMLGLGLFIKAPDITAEAAAAMFVDHPHITVFPGDGVDIMPFVTDPPV